MRGTSVQARVVLLGVLCVLLLPASIHSQAVQGSIFGNVKDPSGAAIPGAQVTVTNLATSEVRTTTSDSAGAYQVPGLTAGNYSITAQAGGFKTFQLPQIALAVGENGRYDVSMQIGTANQTVTVTGETALIDTTDAAVSQEVTNKQVLDLPLNGRSFTDLAQLEPGVVFATSGHSATAEGVAGGRGISLTVNGGNVWDNLWLLDGTLINDDFNKTPGSVSGVMLGVETLQEFKVNTSTYGAELSGMGGVVDAVTKSGTNDFHGDAFGFWRDKVLDSRDFFEPASGALPFVRRQYGATVGGPIVKNKTFFFLGYEGFRQNSSSVAQVNVPDNNARLGIINGASVISAANGCKITPSTCLATIQPILNQYPQLQYASSIISDSSTTGVAVATFPQKGFVSEDYLTGRIDEIISNSLTLFSRFTFDQSHGIFFSNGTQMPNWGEADNTHGQYLTIGATKIFSSNLVNRALYSYTRPTLASIDAPTNIFGTAGLPQASLPTRTGIDEGFSVTGLTATGGNNVEPLAHIQKLHQASDDVTYTKGKNSWKFGVAYRHYSFPSLTDFYPDGSWSFSSLTSLLNDAATTFTYRCITGENPLINIPDGCTAQDTYHQWNMAFYGSDEWKITPRLTATLGLRYEYTSSPTEDNSLESWLPTPFLPGETGNSVIRGEWWQNPQTYRDFMPRAGIAWDVRGNGRTAVRAGAGIYDEQTLLDKYDTYRIQGPQYYLAEIGAQYGTASPVFPCPLTSSATNPGSFPCPTSGYTVAPNLAGQVRFFEGKIKSPTMYRYSVTLDQQIGRSNSISVGYVGSVGRHEILTGNLNLETPQTVNGGLYFAPVAPANTLPGAACAYVNNCSFGNESLLALAFAGNSIYNSLQVTAQHRTSSLLVQGSYTLSRSTDNASAIHGDDYSTPGGSSSVADIYDLPLSYGRSNFNATNRLATNLSYNIPGPTSGLKALQEVLGGWELTYNFIAQSGVPFTIAGANPPTAGGAAEPYCTAIGCTTATGTLPAGATFPSPITYGVLASSCTTSSMIQPGNATHYYNPACVQLAPAGVVNPAGFLSRGSLTGPGFIQSNASLIKNFKITESKTLQFRIEGFNILNHPNFALPISAPFTYTKLSNGVEAPIYVGSNASNPYGTSGAILNTVVPGQGGRVVQLGAKFIF